MMRAGSKTSANAGPSPTGWISFLPVVSSSIAANSQGLNSGMSAVDCIVRYFDSSEPRSSPPTQRSVRKLVSLRELARGERMSRYKLNRLLTAAGIRPVHRGGQAIYFDGNEAREAVRDRLDRESSAMSLVTLADRTGVSAAVLARKVRQGCISTTGQASHAVDASEAERIGEVVRSLHSRSRKSRSTGNLSITFARTHWGRGRCLGHTPADQGRRTFDAGSTTKIVRAGSVAV